MNTSVHKACGSTATSVAGINGATQQTPIPPVDGASKAEGCDHSAAQAPLQGGTTPTQDAVDGAVGGSSGAPAGVQQLPGDLTAKLAELIARLKEIIALLDAKAGTSVGGEQGKPVRQAPPPPPSTVAADSGKGDSGKSDDGKDPKGDNGSPKPAERAPARAGGLSAAAGLNLGIGL